MDELKRILQTKADEMRIDPVMPSALRTRSRRRRLGNAAVAVAVVGAVGFGSFTGFRFALEQSAGPRPLTPAHPAGRGVDSLFPEPHLVSELQREADSGRAREWLDHKFVATEFASVVMGWSPQETRFRVEPGRPVRVSIWNPMLTLTDPIQTILTMQRYENRDDGIFMVTMAQAPDIRIDTPTPWDPVRPGQRVQVQGGVGFHHEGGALEAAITTVPGGTPTSIGQEYAPEFVFEIQAPEERAIAASFTAYSAEGTYVAMTAFRLQGLGSSSAEEEAGPSPGPTPTSDDATPAAIPVELSNASTRADVTSYVTQLLANQGRGIHHGGYRVSAATETEGSEVTVILYDMGLEAEAERVARLFFPDAELRPGDTEGSARLTIVVGEDFGQRHAEALEAFGFVQEFSEARREGDGADRYLGPKAATYYYGDRDASLYGYAKGCDFEVMVGEDSQSRDLAEGSVDEFYIHICRFPDDIWSERVRVAPIDGELKIVDAAIAAIVSE
jgi:LytR cell envelope-related transcriptional attenuator